MSRICDLTGKQGQTGHKVSHSNIKTKKRFRPNLQRVTFRSDALKRDISLDLATNTIRSIDHNGGLDQFLVSAKSNNLTPEAQVLRRKIKKIIAKNKAA